MCASCHAKTKDAIQKAKSKHAPAAGDECTTCHNPHGSDVKGILTDRMDRLCYSCHSEEETKFLKTYTHQPVREGSCAACHDPHGSAESKLLKADGPKLCASCHAALLKPIEAGRATSRSPTACASRVTTRTAATSRGWPPTASRTCARTATRTQDRRGGGKSKHQPAVAGECAACHNPHQAALPRADAGEEPGRLPRVPQGPSGRDGGGPHALARRARLPPLPPAPRVGRERAAGEAGPRRLCRVPRPEGAVVRRRAPPDRPVADPVRAVPRSPRVEGTALLQEQRAPAVCRQDVPDCHLPAQAKK